MNRKPPRKLRKSTPLIHHAIPGILFPSMESQPHPVAAQQWIAALLAIVLALIPACATRNAAESAAPTAESTTGEASAAPPAPSPEPTPAQPQAVYRVTVSTEAGGTEEAVIAADGSSAAESAPPVEAAATPVPAPGPTPKPGNFLSRTWQKVFPPRTPPAPKKPSDVIQVPMPREGLLSRMWHSIFPRKKTPPAALPPQWIGRIQLVDEQGGYALIDTQGGTVPPVGQILRAVGNDLETGSLKISADRNPPFFIADIENGKPQPGDRVYAPEAP